MSTAWDGPIEEERFGGTCSTRCWLAHRSIAESADVDLVSLPPIHDGDVRVGSTFGVACESIEAVHVIDGERLLLGCHNNFPNTGRNPTLSDDNELIVVRVPGLKSLH